MNKYTVNYERDKAGWWVASVIEVPGCHTQGRSIQQARRRVREALGLWVDDAEESELIDHIRLPKNAQTLVRRHTQQRHRLDEQSRRAQESTIAAIRQLVDGLNLSVRDASAVLGISHQRVQQLLDENASSLTAEKPKPRKITPDVRRGIEKRRA